MSAPRCSQFCSAWVNRDAKSARCDWGLRMVSNCTDNIYAQRNAQKHFYLPPYYIKKGWELIIMGVVHYCSLFRGGGCHWKYLTSEGRTLKEITRGGLYKICIILCEQNNYMWIIMQKVSGYFLCARGCRVASCMLKLNSMIMKIH